jgi:methylated-DNA-[protein]-cysteine S-methyltransferase
VATDANLVAVLFAAHHNPPRLDARSSATHDVLDHAAHELGEYFRGQRCTFSTPIAAGGTDFQRTVWDALRTIPFGETRSYGQLAAMLERPRAMRAVGHANGRNPLSIFVPCHRVIGHHGTLCGYAGGVAAKRWLLDHERAARDHAP